MRVVEDSQDRLVAWLAGGSQIMYWALPDGRDPRVLPVAERFTAALTTASSTWQGNGVLRVIPIAEPFQVIHFWNDDGVFTGWYVNFEALKIRSGSCLDTVDWHLDLWISAAGGARDLAGSSLRQQSGDRRCQLARHLRYAEMPAVPHHLPAADDDRRHVARAGGEDDEGGQRIRVHSGQPR